MTEPAPHAAAAEWTVSRGMPLKEYHAIFGVSGSGIHRALKSPAHWKAQREAPPEDSRAMLVGSALHTLILEPGEFAKRYRIFEDRGDKRRQPTKGAWEAIQAEAAAEGADILDADERDSLKGMQAALLQHPDARRLIEESEIKEASLVWRPAHVPFALKTRPDMIHGGAVVVDLKKTKDASPKAFQRAAVDYGYFHQAAWNRWMIARAAEAGMIRLDPGALRFLILAVEEPPPHGVVVYEIPSETLADLEPVLKETVAALAASHLCGHYEAYPQTIHTLNLPEWARK
jgi:exodeoxyribonuclease VIII